MGSIAFVNANVIPMAERERYSAVLAVDGRIEALGTDEKIRAAAEKAGAEVIDLNGKTVLPGFHDCHVHLSITGYDAAGINMYDAPDIKTVLDRLQEADETWPEGRWLYGKRIDEGLLAERRPPTMEELDRFSRPVFISDRGGHYVLVNRKAFDALGIDENMRGVRKGADGKPNGRLQDEANRTARTNYPHTKEENLEAMMWTCNEALTKGITTIHAQEGFGPDDPAVPLIIENRDKFPVDLQIWWLCAQDNDDPTCKELGIWGGDILLDGSIGSRTAAFFENYCDGDGCGYLNFDEDFIYDHVEGAVVRDQAISFHAIGEKGIWFCLNAYERALKLHPEKKETARLRMEHMGWPTEEDMARAAEMGVRISTQPAFTFLRGGPTSIYRSRLGEAREKRGYPLRRMLDYGLIVGGGSDSDMTPMDVMLGIHSAVNQPYPENSVTPYEAVRMYTYDGAKCGWEDDIKGRLLPGLQADMVVLDDDPMTCDPRILKDIKILMTVRKGDIVYRNT
ncbi:MAG: amidohydrolase [Lachnospiraceae bacterium]|nr:amidohydrolase [Lachnospiraceae bacterium]